MRIVRSGIWITMITGATACGSVAGTPDAPVRTGDARPTDGLIDTAPPRCNPTATFGVPVAVDALNTPSDDEGPRLSPDELTLYFSSDRGGGVGSYDIYSSTRASTSEAWSTPSLVAGVNTAGLERRPTVTADGLTLYAFNGTHPNYEIAVAARTSTAASFGALTPIASINSTGDDDTPFVLPDGAAVYFDSDRGGTSFELYRTANTGTELEAPEVLTGTNLETAEQDSPVLTPDELTLYFSSDRVGGGGTDLMFEATRTSVANGFGNPVALNIDPTGKQIVMPSWVSSDNCVLYFTSKSTRATSDYDIYYAVRGN